jgi:hypothetical protein
MQPGGGETGGTVVEIDVRQSALERARKIHKQRSDDFSQILRKIVIHEQRGVLKELAASLGLSYGAFYNRLKGRAEFNPREINILLRELADTRLVDCLLAGTDFQVLRRPADPTPESDRDITEIALSSGARTLAAVGATLDGLGQRGLDRERVIHIESMICDAQQELQALKAALVLFCERDQATERLPIAYALD